MKFPAFEPIDFQSDIDVFSVHELLLDHVFPDSNQPRKKFLDSSLEELAASIKQHGIIQPIIVEMIEDDKYQIIAGERRWRASKLAGLAAIPAITINNNTQENLAISLIENIQREELNPIELAQAFFQLSTKHSLSHESIAAMVGKSRATVTNLLRLLNLSQYVKDLLIHNKLEMGHARSLLTLPADQQAIMAKKIVEKNLSVREVEKLVQQSKKPREKKIPPYAEEVNIWVKKLSERLSSKVAVNINEKGEGRVLIHFSSPEEVNWLVEQISDKVY